MGPWHFGWYEEHGLIYTVMEPASEIYAKHTGVKEGDLVEIRRISKHIAGGRIDVVDDSKEGYDGHDEYSVPLMTQESWNAFGEFLNELETEHQLHLEELISTYESFTYNKIEWYNQIQIEDNLIR